MTNKLDVLKEFQNNGYEQRFEAIVSDLIFLSKVKQDQKINVSTKQIMNDTFLGNMYRTYLRVEGKDLTIKYIRDIINEAINQMYFFKSLKDPFYQNIAEIIKKEVLNARGGIICLSKTYNYNESLASEFETLLELINIKLAMD